MTDKEAIRVLDDLLGPERIEAAELIVLFREWEASGISVEGALSVLKRLRPVEVIEVMQYARRKVERARRR